MKIVLNGACGRMGREILRLIESGYHGAELAAAVDRNAAAQNVYAKLSDFHGEADVIIDFSTPDALPDLLAFATERKLPLLIATTGHSADQAAQIRDASTRIPVLHSANTSIAIVLLTELIQRTVALFPEADVEIVETHHNRKADAPSGTALTLARAIQAVRPAAKILTGRSGASKRKPEDVTISAVRRGNIVGTHEVLISTDTQTITLKHEAHDRALFAEGAIAAAEILARRGPGYLTMQDIFDEPKGREG